MALFFVYPIGLFAWFGEIWNPLATQARGTDGTAYAGESRAELIERGIADLQKAHPESFVARHYTAMVFAACFGMVGWLVVIGVLVALLPKP